MKHAGNKCNILNRNSPFITYIRYLDELFSRVLPRLPRLQKANPYSLQSIRYLDEIFSQVLPRLPKLQKANPDSLFEDIIIGYPINVVHCISVQGDDKSKYVEICFRDSWLHTAARVGTVLAVMRGLVHRSFAPKRLRTGTEIYYMIKWFLDLYSS